MEAQLRATLEAIHASPYEAVIVCAGAGGRAIEQLLALPGSSRTVLEAVIPYSRGAFAAFLGSDPQHFTTAEVSRDLAERAYERACRWASPDARPLGVACTASLATTLPKRGDHRAFISIRDAHSIVTYALTLTKGTRDRAGEEQVVSDLLLSALAEACGVPEGTSLHHGDTETRSETEERHASQRVDSVSPLPSVSVSPCLRGEDSSTSESVDREQAVVERQDLRSPLGRLLAGEVGAVLVLPDGEMRRQFPAPRVLFSGAFNPLHAGHLGLAQVAAQRLGAPVTFEISATNVDKPPLSEVELRRRLAQFAGRAPVAVSDAPTFVEKARLFPGCTFLIGADTLERLFAPRYYGGEEPMLAALAEIQVHGCHFLVAGRHYQGTYRAPDTISIPEPFRPMFDAIPEAEFRMDLSSTQLRGGGG